METIFEHKVTEKELNSLLGSPDWTIEDFSDWTQADHYALLYRLYCVRGNKDKARHYYDKVPDTDWKYFSLGNHCCF